MRFLLRNTSTMADDDRSHSTTRYSEAQELAQQLKQISPSRVASWEEDARLHAHATLQAVEHAPTHVPAHVVVDFVVHSFVSL